MGAEGFVGMGSVNATASADDVVLSDSATPSPVVTLPSDKVRTCGYRVYVSFLLLKS